ncbi:hypothetical protein [Chitinophaga sp.]|uniref:hypothetical protein n=1 Tax=Chitinophaga sp. TaxID=1869181 RepID=UPI0031D64E78
MTKAQIDQLLTDMGRHAQEQPRLIETHISWVIAADKHVYKIKKPVHYSFLDFSTLEKRKYYCEQEITLNKRLTENIYIDVLPVSTKSGHYSIGEDEGDIADYAVRMAKVDGNLQMDVLLSNNKVTPENIRKLAEKIANFHKYTTKIYEIDPFELASQFNDLGNEVQFLSTNISAADCAIIEQSIHISDRFIKQNASLLLQRVQNGYIRDCHGDLHTRNIFLLPDPQPFDCIEFNDSFRQIDILNEIAFLCMDLDAADRQDLSDMFVSYYNEISPAMNSIDEQLLFVYYKSYRANVRAKVNSLRAGSTDNEITKKEYLRQTVKYLRLMEHYLRLTA